MKDGKGNLNCQGAQFLLAGACIYKLEKRINGSILAQNQCHPCSKSEI